jgi:hypothetical protein
MCIRIYVHSFIHRKPEDYPGNTEDVCPIAQIGFINHRYIENKRNREIKFVLPNARLISEMKVFTCLHKGPGNKFFPIFFM